MQIELCMFFSNSDSFKTINYHLKLITELTNKFGKITFVNFIKIQNKQENHSIKAPNVVNSRYFIPESEKDFINYIKSKKIIAIDCLGKDLNFFKIRTLINKTNIYLALIINTGVISNAPISISKFNFYNDIKNKIKKKIYRFLVLLKVFPSIDIYFDPRRDIIENIEYKIKKYSKLQSIVKIFNILYFKECYRINCKSYDNYLELNKLNIKKKIIFLDGNYKHQDIEKRSQKISDEIRDKYFNSLENIFQNFEKEFNLDVEICLHPTSNINEYKKFFKTRNIYINKTSSEIPNAEIILFHESGSVNDAILQKKIIVSLVTRLLGGYYYQRIINYKQFLDLFSIDIDKNEEFKKDEILKNFNNSVVKFEYYINNFLKSENTPSYKKITNIIYEFSNKI